MQLRLLPLTLAWAWQEPFERHERKHCSRVTKARESSEDYLGAEEDGFALEHLYGDEQRKGGIDAAGRQDEQNVVPMKSAGNNLLANQAGAENGNQSELGIQIETGQERSNRRDNHDEGHRREVTLCFFVAFGEQSNGQQGCREEHRQGQGHEKNG